MCGGAFRKLNGTTFAEAGRERAQRNLEFVFDTIITSVDKLGCSWVFCNPVMSKVWSIECVHEAASRPGTVVFEGHGCQYGMRGVHGGLMKLATRWMTNNSEFVKELGEVCKCEEKHELCRGKNVEKASIWSDRWVDALLTVVRNVVESKDPLRFREPYETVYQFKQVENGADEWLPRGDRMG